MLHPERVLAFAALVAVLAWFFTRVAAQFGEKKALLYTAILFKFAVLTMILLGLDTTLFHIVIYRRAGAALIKRAVIPVTAGELAILTSFTALLVGLGLFEHIKARAEEINT